MATIVSGLQPTGQLHIGNYFGFLEGVNASLSKFNHSSGGASLPSDEAFLFVADLHAITASNRAEDLTESTINAAATILAGLSHDSAGVRVFVQSHVRQHAEFAWFTTCLTPLGWLNRMHQFKSKAGKRQAAASAGLYTYPSLMAADVLLYRADKIPVGEDQKQHVELACHISKTLQSMTKERIFPIPKIVIPKLGKRIMSLRDAGTKMSKSDPSAYSRINLLDDDATIAAKIRKAKTDSLPLPQDEAELEQRPEVSNLMVIFALASQQSLKKAVASYRGQQTSIFKQDITEALIARLSPVRERIRSLLSDRQELFARLKHDALIAEQKAEETMRAVRKIFHLLVR